MKNSIIEYTSIEDRVILKKTGLANLDSFLRQIDFLEEKRASKVFPKIIEKSSDGNMPWYSMYKIYGKTLNEVVLEEPTDIINIHINNILTLLIKEFYHSADIQCVREDDIWYEEICSKFFARCTRLYDENWAGKSLMTEPFFWIDGIKYSCFQLLEDHSILIAEMAKLQKKGPHYYCPIHGDLEGEHIIISSTSDYWFIDPTPPENNVGDVSKDFSKLFMSLSGRISKILSETISFSNNMRFITSFLSEKNPEETLLNSIENNIKNRITYELNSWIDQYWFERSKVLEAFNFLNSPLYYQDTGTGKSKLLFLTGVKLLNSCFRVIDARHS